MSGGSTSPMECAREVYKAGGVKGFYAGLDAALMRQAVYSTLRLGIFNNLSDSIKASQGG
jgi:solute carrier family 25 oxoglutarate transporter 11